MLKEEKRKKLYRTAQCSIDIVGGMNEGIMRDEKEYIQKRKDKGKGLGGKMSGIDSLIVALTEQVALEQIQAVVEEVQ